MAFKFPVSYNRKMVCEVSLPCSTTDESVYHKPKLEYEIQNEVRMTVICPDKLDKYELEYTNNGTLRFTMIPLVYGKPVLIELQDLEIENGIPVRFFNDIKYYESTDDILTSDLILQ